MYRSGLFYITLVIVLISTNAMDEEMAELAKMLRESCAGETGVDLSFVEKVNQGTDLSSITDGVFKCYIKCIMETAGMMSGGVYDIEAVLAILPEEMRKKNEGAIRDCGTKKGGDDCETAYLTQVCWQNANKAEYFLI